MINDSEQPNYSSANAEMPLSGAGKHVDLDAFPDAIPAAKPVPEMTLSTASTGLDKPVTVKNFDLERFIAGVRPSRRAVTLYARGDMLADLDVLEEKMRVARGSGQSEEVIEGLKAQAQEIVEIMRQESITVRLEGRSQEAIDRACEGIDKDANPFEWALTALNAHIVEPEGMSVDDLRAISEVQPLQFNAMLQLAFEVDTKAPTVPSPFSGRFSR